MGQQSRALTAFAVGLGLVPRHSDALIWPPRVLCTHGSQTHNICKSLESPDILDINIFQNFNPDPLAESGF